MKKGFTLIELLVVIAIIGILSSVVLASLNTARDKGSDAAVKANLNGMRSQAELFYDSNQNSYADMMTGTGTAVPTGGDSNMRAALQAADDANGTGSVTWSVSATAWAVAAELKSNNALAYCVDSKGNATTTNADSVDAVTDISDANGCL